jgi:hypothetical protein
MNVGWFEQDCFAGRLLPQPKIEQDGGFAFLDDSFSNGFVAILPSGKRLPEAITSHALWRTLAPEVRVAPSELDPFLEGAEAAILLRPDRFVLAQVPLEERGIAVLDSLQKRLEAASTELH